MTDKSNQPKIARRQVLKGALGVGALAASGLGFLSSQPQRKIGDVTQLVATNPSPLRFALNLMATMETLAVHFYKEALSKSIFLIDEDALDQLQQMISVETSHLSFWQQQGGIVQVQQFQLPTRAFTDAHTFVNTGMTLESVFAGVYLTATQQLSAMGQPRLAAITAQHAASEVQHHTMLAHIAGLSIKQSPPLRPFACIEEAVPYLMDFIETQRD